MEGAAGDGVARQPDLYVHPAALDGRAPRRVHRELQPAHHAVGEGEQPRVRLPLPRPKGALKNTFCDETLRISRGGRGGVFITSRVD